MARAQLERVTGPGLPAYGAVYSRLENGELIERTDLRSDAILDTRGGFAALECGAFPARQGLASVENRWAPGGAGEDLVSKYAYVNDNLARRASVVRTGTAFAEAHFDLWGYNDRNELTCSRRFSGATIPDPLPDPEVPGGDPSFGYAYDWIGSRVSYTFADPPQTTWYASNALNQYTSTSNPSEQFTYDLDGNLTEDGAFTYSWDAENRLTTVAPASSPVEGSKKLLFTYDYMNGRVRKQVYDWDENLDGGAGGWPEAPSQDSRFVYDGWNVLLVLDGLNGNAVVRKYTWGLDLSGLNGDRSEPSASAVGIHGAGGIGGLLATQDAMASEDHLYLYDGNGNVGQLIDVSDGGIAAKYEYDPYGNTLLAGGHYASANPFRFSTKYWDNESGLGYWGYRYYTPRLGRWTSRDPIEEEGGENLYAFVRNQPANYVDPTGLACNVSYCTPQPGGDPNNLDENTNMGKQLKPLASKTKCGIFVVRVTNAPAFGMGHTMLVWDEGSVGFQRGETFMSEHQEIQNVNKTGRPISAYGVEFRSSRGVPDHAGHGIAVPSKWGAGPPIGQCCPKAPSCEDIKACLGSLMGQGCGYDPNKAAGKSIDERYNCNSGAQEALEKCCLRRGDLVLDNYSGRNTSVRHHDNEGNNIGWGWLFFP